MNGVGTVPITAVRHSRPLPPSPFVSRCAVRGRAAPPEGGCSVLLALWSPKGGSGTSVVAAALALVAAGRGESRLADLGGDQPAILGLPPMAALSAADDGLVGWLSAGPSAPTEWLDDLAAPVSPGLSVLLRGSGALEAATAEAGAALAVALR